jgi:hypothetical protein
MSDAVSALAGNCQGLSVETVKDGSVEIQVAKYKTPGMVLPKFKTMVVAGEHAREMIGPEIAMNFVKALCGQATVADIEEAKKDTEFLVVMNANPASRASVEQGEYCTRVNQNQVDINRNFDVDWQNAEQNNRDTNPGQHAFDQPESRMLKTLMEKFQPHAYLDLHSGFRGMFFPNQVARDSELSMQLQRLVAPVDEATCQCPLGVANKEVGYHTSGSALDYSFEKLHVPFTMAMEVFIGESATGEIQELESRWSTQKSELLKPVATGSSFMENGISPFTQIAMRLIESHDANAATGGLSPGECLAYFNPVQKSKFDEVVGTWTNALATLSIKSRSVEPNAAIEALKKKPVPAMMQKTVEEPKEDGSAPLWLAVKILGFLAVVYVAIKYYKVKQSKSAESAPLSAQMTPVQISD